MQMTMATWNYHLWQAGDAFNCIETKNIQYFEAYPLFEPKDKYMSGYVTGAVTWEWLSESELFLNKLLDQF